MKQLWLALFLVFALCNAAHAAPPPGEPVDPDIAAWFQSLRQADGFPCCGWADCRHPAAVSIDVDHYQVALRREDYAYDNLRAELWNRWFGSASIGWVEIPDQAIVIRPDNPTGQAVVCWGIWNNTVFCFIPWETGG